MVAQSFSTFCYKYTSHMCCRISLVEVLTSRPGASARQLIVFLVCVAHEEDNKTPRLVNVSCGYL